MTELIKGVDLSHHQSPAAINWIELAKTHGFVIVRATYGTKCDTACAEHIQRACDVGMKTGLYHFFRSSQDAQAQLDAFASVAELLSFGPGWLLPALDVEVNVANGDPLSAAKYAPAEAMCEAWVQRWGRVLIYTNVNSWASIGNPGWIREHLLWAANFDVATPATPLDMPWTIWQHKVAVLPDIYSGPIDQNVANTLPLIQQQVSPDADTEPAPAPSLIPIEVDWAEVNTNRDDLIKNKD